MIIYLVKYEGYDEYTIKSAWSTRELAELAEKFEKQGLTYDRECIGIEEVEVVA